MFKTRAAPPFVLVAVQPVNTHPVTVSVDSGLKTEKVMQTAPPLALDVLSHEQFEKV
jgi:hypothetical protein